MQFISIKSTDTLRDLIKSVGNANAQAILAANDLSWSPNIGKQFKDKCDNIMNAQSQSRAADSAAVDHQRKATILNGYVQSDDVFEKAALASEDEWKVISNLGTFPGMLKVPESIELPDSSDVLGSKNAVSRTTYEKAMAQLQKAPHKIDPAIFNEYSTIKNANMTAYSQTISNAMKWFKIPWGEITLHSSMDNESMDFPCYPQEPSDGKKANYTQMPDLLYQSEPWQIYESSGPRSNTYTFDIHRHMWSGDHNDGMANKLIRFCEAHCYPKFNGSLVNTSIATLYVHGNKLIRGVITDVNTEWDGPIADDGWYLHVKLSITITEVSDEPLSYDAVKSKPLIG